MISTSNNDSGEAASWIGEDPPHIQSVSASTDKEDITKTDTKSDDTLYIQATAATYPILWYVLSIH